MPLNYCCSKPNLRCPAFQKPQCAFQGIILRQVICWTSVILPSECRKSSQGQDTKPHCFAPPFSTSNCGERIHPQTSWRGHSPYPPCCSSLEPKDPQQRWIIALFTPGSGKKKKCSNVDSGDSMLQPRLKKMLLQLLQELRVFKWCQIRA